MNAIAAWHSPHQSGSEVNNINAPLVYHPDAVGEEPLHAFFTECEPGPTFCHNVTASQARELSEKRLPVYRDR
nr:hypothetical protein [uncultured organism]